MTKSIVNEKGILGMLLAITGRSGVGKTTTAQELARHLTPAGILPFAKPLKELATLFFGWDGRKNARGRRLLQTLGTDVGREWDPEFWVRKWQEAMMPLLDAGCSVIADDLRFANEAATVHLFGGKVIRLHCPAREIILPHASENQEFEVDWDIFAAPDTTPAEIAAQILEKLV